MNKILIRTLNTTLFVLFMNVFYTSLILPLFNKLTPMEEGALYDSIKSYSEKVRFPLKNIFVMESKEKVKIKGHRVANNWRDIFQENQIFLSAAHYKFSIS